MEKRAIDVFEEKVKDELPNHNNSHKESFHKVNDEIEQKIGFKIYPSYSAYKMAKSRRDKRKKIDPRGTTKPRPSYR